MKIPVPTSCKKIQPIMRLIVLRIEAEPVVFATRKIVMTPNMHTKEKAATKA